MDDHANYSRSALLGFLDMMASKGLTNGNTAVAIKTACGKILVDLSDAEESDVRKVDVPLAIRKFNNKNPGTLSPASLAEYQRRVALAIREFGLYNSNPTSYRGIGSGKPRAAKPDSGEPTAATRPKKSTEKARRPQDEEIATATPAVNSAGLSFAFPLRNDFLAQLVLPRDMKSDEANRLCAFVRALAIDHEPK
jgi:hypothetical protein